jgi:hypothetical protein
MHVIGHQAISPDTGFRESREFYEQLDTGKVVIPPMAISTSLEVVP